MNKENNNQQEVQTPVNMSYPAPNEKPVENNAPVVPQSENGRWEPVDPSTLNFTVSGDMNQPMQGPDGSYYCISNSQSEYNSIQANQNNAVPTPSSIVQLPPIVQPIAMVPYASQNQPLLQYDPNYRPPEPQTPEAPKYRLKPYRGISFVQILFAIATLVLLAFMIVVDGKNASGSTIDWTTYRASGLDTIYGLLSLFGLTSMSSAYYSKLLETHFTEGIGAAFSGDFVLSLMYILIPCFVAIVILIAIIMIISYIVKMGKLKSPRGFNIGAFINLCLTGGIIAMIFAVSKRESMRLYPGIFTYVAAGISLFMIIFSYFARKNAYIIDETALKKVYIINDNEKA